MKTVGLPALTSTYENYIWVIHDETNAWVIDPGEAPQVLDFLQKNNLNLKAILVTHRHPDHVNGIPDILAENQQALVYGPEKCDLPFIQYPCSENDLIELDSQLIFRVLDTPGHTEDHITFYNDEKLFCGDTLFTGGCGRILGGTTSEFANSILRLRELPDELAFYCPHEYTDSNLKFARLVEPDNQPLIDRIANTEIAYPSTINEAQSSLGMEKNTNPFLRFDTPDLKAKLLDRGATDDPVSLFTTLRNWKDQWDHQN